MKPVLTPLEQKLAAALTAVIVAEIRAELQLAPPSAAPLRLVRPEPAAPQGLK